MTEIWRFFHEAYREIGGVLGIAVAVLATIWMDRWSRLPLATIGAACLYGLVTAVFAAIRYHVYWLPDFGSSVVWVSLVPLYLSYGALISLLFFLKSAAFGPFTR